MDSSLFQMFLNMTVVTMFIYGSILHPLRVSPLRKIPNAHPTSAFLPLWILWVRYQGRENRTLLLLHRELGPIIRLAPNEVSVSCDDGVKLIYGGLFDKHHWYTRFRNHNGYASRVTCEPMLKLTSTPTLFTILPSDLHSERRQKVSRILSQSFLQNSPDLMVLAKMIIFFRLLPIIDHSAQSSSPLNMTDINDATAVDLITGFVFGSAVGTNLLQDTQTRKEFLTYHRRERSHGFWLQELPRLTTLLKTLGFPIFSSTVITASKWLETWFVRSFSLVEAGLKVSTPMYHSTQAVMYRNLRPLFNGSSPPSRQSPVLELMAELHDHCVAGYETTGQMLTSAMHALSSKRDVQTLLRTELRSSQVCPFFGAEIPIEDLQSTKLPTPAQMAALPLLHAIVIETLRLRDRGPLPRVTPKQSVSIAGSPPLPPNVRVAAASYVLHHDPQVFPSPSEWNPRRWLTSPQKPGAPEKRGRMGKSFMAFGSGSRTCVGRDFAMYEMKLVLAAIYTNYETTLGDGQAQRADLWAAGDQLNIGFTRAE